MPRGEGRSNGKGTGEGKTVACNGMVAGRQVHPPGEWDVKVKGGRECCGECNRKASAESRRKAKAKAAAKQS